MNGTIEKLPLSAGKKVNRAPVRAGVWSGIKAISLAAVTAAATLSTGGQALALDGFGIFTDTQVPLGDTSCTIGFSMDSLDRAGNTLISFGNFSPFETVEGFYWPSTPNFLQSSNGPFTVGSL